MNRTALIVALALSSFVGCAAPAMDVEETKAHSSSKIENDAVEICDGQKADASGTSDASVAINACIKKGGTIALPPGLYRLDAPIVIETLNVTLTTKGLANAGFCENGDKRCAQLKASSTYTADALVRIGKDQVLSNVLLDHLVIDGNGTVRRSNPGATEACAAGGGRTIMEYGGVNIALTKSAIVNGMCGTAIGWSVGRTGVTSTIFSNLIANNGADYREATGMWSDGLTIGAVKDLVVDSNSFEDDTDVDLILGGATGTSRVVNNFIAHKSKYAFAGFMLTNWSNPADGANAQWADFRGLDVSNNAIHCDDLCDIGMSLGVFAWIYDPTYWANFRIMGGNVHGNDIHTSRQGIVVAGAGTGDYALTLGLNNYNVTAQAGASTFAAPKTRDTGKLSVHDLWNENFIAFTDGEDKNIDNVDAAWHHVF